MLCFVPSFTYEVYTLIITRAIICTTLFINAYKRHKSLLSYFINLPVIKLVINSYELYK